MSRYDFIGDFLTSIRNAAKANKEKVTAPASVITVRIAELLKQEGFVDNVKPFNDGNKNFVRIHLKYLPGGKEIGHPGAETYVDPGVTPLCWISGDPESAWWIWDRDPFDAQGRDDWETSP